MLFRSRLAPGNGLGMTIVREIVTAHGGVIEIVSAPGDGTEVALWLPARAGAVAGDAAAV